jgi:hypothetical protein
MALQFKVNYCYERMCSEAKLIVQSEGDRFSMRGQWQYPRALYEHLMDCPKCEGRPSSRAAQRLLPLNPAEVSLLVEALSLLSMTASAQDAGKGPAIEKLMATLESKRSSV